jgi:hypothetical protein
MEGPYFSQFLEESAAGDRMEGTSDVRNVLEEVQMELIKNSKLKLWLEDFYNFCQVVCLSAACPVFDFPSHENQLVWILRKLAVTPPSSWGRS